jgi:hypothetical protein
MSSSKIPPEEKSVCLRLKIKECQNNADLLLIINKLCITNVFFQYSQPIILRKSSRGEIRMSEAEN